MLLLNIRLTKIKKQSQSRGHAPLIPALGSQRQEDLCESETTLGLQSEFRITGANSETPFQKGEGGGEGGSERACAKGDVMEQ